MINKLWDNKIIKHGLLFNYPYGIRNNLIKKYPSKTSSDLITILGQIIDSASNGGKDENIFLGD